MFPLSIEHALPASQAGIRDLTIRGRRRQRRRHLSLTYNCACSCCHVAVACSGRERQWMSFSVVWKRDSCAVSVCRKKAKTTAFLRKNCQGTEVMWHFTYILLYLYLNERNFEALVSQILVSINIPVRIGKPLEKYAKCIGYVYVDAVASNPVRKI